MKKIIQILLCLVCCSLSGCGMLATPHRVAIPHQSMQKVLVVDQDTKQPLAGASVTCQMYEYKNWMKPVPFWGVTSPTNTSQVQVTERPDQKVWSWPAQPQGQGVFVIEPKRRTGWTQIWFPLPSPLGWFLYRTYDGRIVASAPDHKTVWISNPVATSPSGLPAEPYSESYERYYRIEKEQMTIMLPKENSSHNN
jgi:hypothetical protein